MKYKICIICCVLAMIVQFLVKHSDFNIVISRCYCESANFELLSFTEAEVGYTGTFEVGNISFAKKPVVGQLYTLYNIKGTSEWYLSEYQALHSSNQGYLLIDILSFVATVLFIYFVFAYASPYHYVLNKIFLEILGITYAVILFMFSMRLINLPGKAHPIEVVSLSSGVYLLDDDVRLYFDKGVSDDTIYLGDTYHTTESEASIGIQCEVVFTLVILVIIPMLVLFIIREYEEQDYLARFGGLDE